MSSPSTVTPPATPMTIEEFLVYAERDGFFELVRGFPSKWRHRVSNISSLNRLCWCI